MAFDYCAYTDPVTGEDSIDHLDQQSSQIQPLSFTSDTRFTNLYQVIEASEASIINARAELLPASSVKLLPTISGRDILAVGKNYVEHAREFKFFWLGFFRQSRQPTAPVIFTKRATSITAHGEDVLLHPGFIETPRLRRRNWCYYRQGRTQDPRYQAIDYVWEYTIINDFTAREKQRDHKQFYIGKSPDTDCPLGPFAVPKERLPEKENIRLQTFVNGEKRQDATLDQLIFSIPNLVSTLSQGQTIQPGDTIATGTPYGVGFEFRPIKFLKAARDAPNPTIERVQPSTSIPTANVKARGNNGLVKIGSEHLSYQFQGQKDGAPIMFIHGLGGSSPYFTPLLDKLFATHALHLTDFEGHGVSPTSALSSLTVSSLAGDIRDVYTLATESNSTPATLIAHSMGCLVALKLALDTPGLVSNLILLGPLPPPSSLPEAGSNASFARAETVRAQDMAAVADAVVSAGLSSKTKCSNPLVVTATKLSLLSQDPEGYAKACMALARSAEETLDVEKVAAKTLILTGTADAVSPPALCEKYGQRIKNTKVVVLRRRPLAPL
ncbi:hypothetical protein BDW66DRAFT_150367 [Aspergillus desertorum]